ncbi:MAG: FAD-dependent oxidoreductase, partial [Gammaproteobacteria bacterium]|nr:FAD-dependent oxidoreductase [Gammaproteobacteria bacterium]
MKIGVPKAVKIMEGRVGLTPEACAELITAGHQVFIEQSAGVLSGYEDEHYHNAGVVIVETAEQLYAQSVLIVKVKEPIEQDLKYIKSQHILFSFLHLAANRNLADRLCETGCTAIAFESIEDEQQQRVILAPMSQIAGKLSIQIGTHLLHHPMGGNGLLLGGIADSERGQVVVLGAGIAGEQAALLAANMGAEVTVFDVNEDKLRYLQELSENINSKYSDPVSIEEALKSADLVVGAVLIPGKHAPKIITEKMVQS